MLSFSLDGIHLSQVIKNRVIGFCAWGLLVCALGCFAAPTKMPVDFAQNIALKVYHFNASQAKQWPLPLKPYFSAAALRSLRASFAEGLSRSVIDHDFSVSARLLEAAEGRLESHGVWQLKLPVEVTYVNPQHHYTQQLLINMRLRQLTSGGWQVEQFLSRRNRCVILHQQWLAS